MRINEDRPYPLTPLALMTCTSLYEGRANQWEKSANHLRPCQPTAHPSRLTGERCSASRGRKDARGLPDPGFPGAMLSPPRVPFDQAYPAPAPGGKGGSRDRKISGRRTRIPANSATWSGRRGTPFWLYSGYPLPPTQLHQEPITPATPGWSSVAPFPLPVAVASPDRVQRPGRPQGQPDADQVRHLAGAGVDLNGRPTRPGGPLHRLGDVREDARRAHRKDQVKPLGRLFFKPGQL